MVFCRGVASIGATCHEAGQWISGHRVDLIAGGILTGCVVGSILAIVSTGGLAGLVLGGAFGSGAVGTGLFLGVHNYAVSKRDEFAMQITNIARDNLKSTDTFRLKDRRGWRISFTGVDDWLQAQNFLEQSLHQRIPVLQADTRQRTAAYFLRSCEDIS